MAALSCACGIVACVIVSPAMTAHLMLDYIALGFRRGWPGFRRAEELQPRRRYEPGHDVKEYSIKGLLDQAFFLEIADCARMQRHGATGRGSIQLDLVCGSMRRIEIRE